MAVNNGLATKAQADEWKLSPEQKALVKRTICKGASDDELALFIQVCDNTGLDPFARQIYSVRRKQYDNATRSYVEAQIIQVSIDGFRLIADRSNQYAGQVGPWWCGLDGEWKEVWLANEPPSAAKCGVLRHNFLQPVYAIALYKGYVQTNSQGDPVSRWKTDPAGMLAKCAEALALRRAFPQELSGLYTTEEMGQADNSTAIETTWKPAAAIPGLKTEMREVVTGGTPAALNEFVNNLRGEPEPPAAVTAAAELGATTTEQPAESNLLYDPAKFVYPAGRQLVKLGKYKWPAAWFPAIKQVFDKVPPAEVEGVLLKLEITPDFNNDTAIGAVTAYLHTKAEGGTDEQRLVAGQQFIAAAMNGQTENG